MQKLYQITIPGFSLKGDFPAARRRLVADFPRVLEPIFAARGGIGCIP
jgi:hypothetical protein